MFDPHPQLALSERSVNVLLVGGWTDQVFTFLRSLGPNHHVNLYVADVWEKSAARFSRHCKEFFLLPPFTSADYIESLLTVCADNQVDVILPTGHEDYLAILPHKQQIIAAGFALPIPDQPLLEQALDKYRVFQLACANGISAPMTFLASESERAGVAEAASFPLLVKLRRATGQKGQKLVRSRQQLEAHIMHLHQTFPLEEIIIQEYIPGTVYESMYTVGLLYDHSHQLKALIPLKKIRSRPYTGGSAICIQSDDRRDVAEMAVRIMESLGGWEGIADVEVKVDQRDNKPRLIEINPRPWGSMYGAYAAGVDLPWLWTLVGLKQEFDAVTVFNNSVYASSLMRDILLFSDLLKEFVLGSDRREALKILATYRWPYLRDNQPVAGVSVTPDFVWDDIRPFLKNLSRRLLS